MYSNIFEMWETGLKNQPRQTASVWGPVQCQRHTDFFARHLLTLNTKLRLQLSIQTALVQDIRLRTKKHVCMVKDLKATSKSTNQIRPVLMPWWNIQGGGVKKQWFFPHKTSYKLGMDEKQGEQVGFSLMYFLGPDVNRGLSSILLPISAFVKNSLPLCLSSSFCHPQTHNPCEVLTYSYINFYWFV